MKLANILSCLLLVASMFTMAYADDGGSRRTNADRQFGIRVHDTDAFARQRYEGCRILDKDRDNGFLEVKIRHEGIEKILLFDGDRWLRTLWEMRREELPERVVSALLNAGFRYENIDDNDEYVVDAPSGRYYAVPAERNQREGIFVISGDGIISHRYTDDSWNDGRIYREDWKHERWDGEDRFDEGDDEWDDRGRRGSGYRGEDDGEDRFDEGDDEWDDHGRRGSGYRGEDDGEDRFDEGDDEWDD